MVADGLRIAISDSYLIVKSLGRIVPHFLQPVGAKAGFGGKIGATRSSAHLIRKISYTRKHQNDRITFGLNKLEIVASVPPAAGRVDVRASRRKVTGEPSVLVDVWRQINAGH